MKEGRTHGATGGEDLSDLIPQNLADRTRRDAAETEAIALAYDRHVFRAKKPAGDWLTDTLLRRVHRDMFDGIWRWAGVYRKTDLNIGVPWKTIPEQIAQLCGDFAFWSTPKSKMAPMEIAARLQNRLTRIHPFMNGNGRHARLITDMFFHSLGEEMPAWPQLQLLPQGDSIRERYVSAMRKADREDFENLISFIQDYRQPS